MKNKLTLLVSFFSISLLISCKSNTNSDTLTKKSLPQTNNAIEGKILAGYQGWFNAKGDGSKLNWKHYGNNAKFYPGSASIDFWRQNIFLDCTKVWLAWTRVGGDILFIESILSKGKGTLNITIQKLDHRDDLLNL